MTMIDDIIADYKRIKSQTGASDESCIELLKIKELREQSTIFPQNFWDAFSQMARVLDNENLGIHVNIHK